MVMIEGIGDEVVVCFGAMFAFLIMILAWISTNVSERHLISVIVVDMRSFHRFLQRIGNIAQRPVTLDHNETQTSGTEEIPVETEASANQEEPEESTQEQAESFTPIEGTERESGSAAAENQEDSPATGDQETVGVPSANVTGTDTSYVPPASEDQLRQRRVAFFNKIQVNDASNTGLNSDDHSEHPCPDSEASPLDETRLDNVVTNKNENLQATELLEGHIRIRLKYLDERQRLVQAKPEDTIGEFKSRHFAAELAQNTIVRFICNGQELKDSYTMNFYNIIDNSVIHCLLTKATQSTQPPVQVRAADFDIGTLMFPLFGLILLLIWYFRFTYRNYFNAMSTFSLIGITFLFIVALLASWRTQDVHDD